MKFIADHQLDGLLLTHGEKGAELFTPAGLFAAIEPDQRIEPVDTVGAGDAFTSILILGLARDWPRKLTCRASTPTTRCHATRNSIAHFCTTG